MTWLRLYTFYRRCGSTPLRAALRALRAVRS
jgi:hypothetical protein